MEADGVNIMSS